MRRDQVELPPAAFTTPPNLEDVVYAVNANTDRVHQLQTENATLRVTDSDFPVPPLKANIAFEQPRNFRLLAQLSQLTGRELDLGSNDTLFWFWLRQDDHLYYARHDEFVMSPARDLVPIEPNQLVSALGLVRLDGNQRHSGPVARDGRWEIRSQIPTPQGDMTRVLLIDATYGWMAEQHLYDSNGQLMMSARADQHRYYPEQAVTMPHHVQVRLLPGQPTQMAFEIDVSRYMFNHLSGDASQRWTMPTFEGYPAVDIADPQFRLPVASSPTDRYRRNVPGQLPVGSLAPSNRLIAPAVPRVSRAAAPADATSARSVYGPPRTASTSPYRGYH